MEEICQQLKAGAYRAPPVRRVEIPKGPGKAGYGHWVSQLWRTACCSARLHAFWRLCLKRTFSIAVSALVQGATLITLCGPCAAMVTGKVSHVFEADIRSYFTRIDHQWLRRMVAHRIADPVILQLIAKWLKAGAMQDRVYIPAGEGTPQGGPISPVLSNLYLHFTLDLWFEKKFKPQCRGEAYLVRFADDFVGRFQFQGDAQRFQRQLQERFAQFNLEMAGEKTRMLLFGRFAAATRASTDRGRRRRVPWLQACLWGRPERALCPDPHSLHQELQEVSCAHT